MMEKVKTNKKLSKKRFITMIVLMCMGTLLIFFKDAVTPFFTSLLSLVDSPKRNSIITVFGLVVGLLHYFYITKDEQESKNIFLATSMGIVNSLGSSMGYSLIVNKGLNFAVGILKDYFQIDAFFKYPDQVDHITLMVVTFVAVYIGGLYLIKMAGESVIELVNPTATPKADVEKNKIENEN